MQIKVCNLKVLLKCFVASITVVSWRHSLPEELCHSTKIMLNLTKILHCEFKIRLFCLSFNVIVHIV